MKYISSLPDKFTALQNALLTAREQGEAVVVGKAKSGWIRRDSGGWMANVTLL